MLELINLNNTIKCSICLYIMPSEFLMFERLLKQFDEQINIGKIQWDLFIYLDIDDSVDWTKTKISKAEILKYFNNILHKFNNKNINIVPIIDKIDIYGCTSARRDCLKKQYDYFLWVDSDIIFKNDFLSYYEQIMVFYNGENIIITPEILKKWYSSWDCLVNKKFLNKDFNFHKYTNVKYEIENIDTNIYIGIIDNSKYGIKYKWGGGCMTCFSKIAMDKVYGIPDSFYHYGFEDTWLMLLFNQIDKNDQPIQLITINNIADEEYNNRMVWKFDEVVMNDRKKRKYYLNTIEHVNNTFKQLINR